MFCLFVCLLFHILAKSKGISVWVPTCDGTYSCQFYSATPVRDQGANTMTWYPTQSHYPDTEPTSTCPVLIIPNIWLGSDKHQFDKSLVWLDHWFESMISHTRDPCSTDSATAPRKQKKQVSLKGSYLVNSCITDDLFASSIPYPLPNHPLPLSPAHWSDITMVTWYRSACWLCMWSWVWIPTDLN